MKLFVSVLLAAASFAQTSHDQPRRAADLELREVKGPPIHLSAYRGKIVLLAFLNTGCEHCQRFTGELNRLQKEYGPRGVQVLGVLFDKNAKEGLERFRQQFVQGFPLGYSDDTTVYNWLSQPAEEGAFVPIVAFVDRRGYLVSRHLGDDMLFQDPDANIRRKLEEMLKARAR